MEATLEVFTVTAADGARSDVRMHVPAKIGAAPALLFFPAMGITAAWYDRFAAALAANGVPTVVAELRGNGSSDVRASWRRNFGYRQLVDHDMPAALAATRDRFPDRRIVIGGHSLGGQLSTLFAAREPDVVDGVLLIACCNVWHRGWTTPLRMLCATQLLALLAHVAGALPGKAIGFGGREARGVMRDWAYTARTGKYRIRGSHIDYEALMTKLPSPVLAVSIDGDDFAPREAVANLTCKLQAAALMHWHIDAPDLGLEQGDHFDWARKPVGMARLVSEWLFEQVLPVNRD